jgi:large subunit ribosomal protein L32e
MNGTKEWIKMTEKKEITTQNALKTRARAKHKKPAFVRPESWKYDKFSLSWRRPRGLDNKVRRKIKGWPPGPSAGYMGPKVARGLHPSGFEEVIVCNVVDVIKVTPETQAARIAHTIGKRKRVLIIAEARKLGIKVLNAKEVKEPVKDEATEEEIKEAKADKKTGKVEKKKEKPKKKTKKGAKKQ